MDNVEAAGDAMRAEAKAWNASADAMARAQARFARLGLAPAAFSVLDPASTPAAADLHRVYAATHDRFTRLLTEASDEFDRMARALRAAAERYEESDREAAARLRGVW